MPDWAGLITAIKIAALDAVKAEKPVAILFGRVISILPLQISVEQKITLEAPQLVFTRTVSQINLEKDDEVILIQVQGGQNFIVLDRSG